LATKGLSDFERKWIRARLQYDGKQFDDGLASLEQVKGVSDFPSKERRKLTIFGELHRWNY